MEHTTMPSTQAPPTATRYGIARLPWRFSIRRTMKYPGKNTAAATTSTSSANWFSLRLLIQFIIGPLHLYPGALEDEVDEGVVVVECGARPAVGGVLHALAVDTGLGDLCPDGQVLGVVFRVSHWPFPCRSWASCA